MNELIKLTKELNDYAKNYHKGPEIISHENVIIAIYYINNLFVESEIDVLLFLTALNLCNAYIKQNKDNISYSFKKSIATIIKVVNEYQLKDLKISTSKDNGNLFIFQLGSIQFSFHDEKKVEINDYYYEEITWDGVKKQICAETLFNMTINSSLAKNSLTMDGENIYEKSNELLKTYTDELVSFEDIINDY